MTDREHYPLMAAVFLAATAVTLLLAFHATDTLELPARDIAMRSLPSQPADATTIVAIDEPSLRTIGPWPWPRDVLAAIINDIADAGARAVVVDVLLAEPRAGDEQLAAAMRRLPTVAVTALDERGEWLVPVDPIRIAAIPAHGNFELDHDGILRRFASTKQSGDRSYVALSLQAASIADGALVPVGRSITPAFRTRPRSVHVISAARLTRDRTARAALRGKIVFFGPTALALADRVLTPVSASSTPDPGVTVHAAATESLIRHQEIRELPPIAAGVLAGILTGIIATRRSGVVRLRTAIAAIVIIIAAGLCLLTTAGVAIPFVVLYMTVVISTTVAEASRVAGTLRRTRTAAMRMEAGLGLRTRDERAEVASRLEVMAVKLVERRDKEVESKRVLAHELKTPLASMRGLSQLLGGFELTDHERRRAASLLESEAGKLQSMVQVLLDLERLPLRDFAQSSSVIDLGDLVRARVDFLRASTDRTLIVDAPADIFARADAALLERVIDNLAGNAIKYAPAPSPVVIRAREDINGVSVEVEDRGPGIGEADRMRVFERFFRGASAAGTAGLGLGLALVADVARWHGGTVEVESADHGGARFRFTIPALHAVAAGSM